MRKIIALLALSMIGLVIAACGSSASSSHPAAASPGPNTSTSSGSTITCADISSDLSTVVSDEKTEQAQLQEAWVSGGKSADLQSLINDNNGATSGSQLNGSYGGCGA
jgi:hypothetical protein